MTEDSMPKTPKTKSGGDAQIKHTGHTTSGQYGTSVDKRPKGRKPARKLNINK